MIVANLTAVFPLLTTPWWIWALVIGAMLAVVGVSILVSARNGSDTPPAPPAEPAEPEPEAAQTEVRLPPPPAVVETSMADLLAEDDDPLPDVESADRDRDDLKRVRGVTFSVAAVLRQAGIQSFAQLAATSGDDLEKILRAAGMRSLDARSWPEQARLAAAGDWQGLEQLQKQLSAKP